MSHRKVSLERVEQLWDSERSLTARQAEDRRAQVGTNDIVESAPHPWWDLIQDTAKDPMRWFFAGTSAIDTFVGQHAEAPTLLVAILPLTGAFFGSRSCVHSTNLFRLREFRCIPRRILCRSAALARQPSPLCLGLSDYRPAPFPRSEVGGQSRHWSYTANAKLSAA